MTLPAPGTPAPEFSLQDLDGKTFSLPEVLILYPVLLVFFRSDCELCHWALPQLARFEWTFKGQDIEIYYVTSDHAVVAAETLRSHRLGDIHVLLDPEGKTAGDYGVEQLPSAVLIGPDGAVVRTAEAWDPEGYTLIGRDVKESVAGIRGPQFGGSWTGAPCPV